MDLNHFKSPDVTPMLVKLYDKQRLYDLAHDDAPSARLELTNVIMELLGMHLTSRETELVADVLIALIRQAEKNLKQALADQLAQMSNVPLRLILEMANDEIDIARPVLEKSDVLGNLDLIYIIKSKSPEYWRAIARRASLDENVIDILADTKDPETAHELAVNDNITLTQHAVQVMSEMAASNKDLAEPLSKRTDIPKELGETLYKAVGEVIKSDVQERYNIAEEDIQIAMVKAIDNVNKKPARPIKEINEHTLIELLKKKQKSAFVEALAKFSGLNSSQCLKIITQEDATELAVICRAKGVQKAEFMSLYLLSGIFRLQDKTAGLDATQKAVQIFENIRPEKAQALLKEKLSS